MLLGTILILAGIAIAIYPPLLSIIAAGILIFVGISMVAISYRYKKMSRHFENPFIDFFFRF